MLINKPQTSALEKQLDQLIENLRNKPQRLITIKTAIEALVKSDGFATDVNPIKQIEILAQYAYLQDCAGEFDQAIGTVNRALDKISPFLAIDDKVSEVPAAVQDTARLTQVLSTTESIAGEIDSLGDKFTTTHKGVVQRLLVLFLELSVRKGDIHRKLARTTGDADFNKAIACYDAAIGLALENKPNSTETSYQEYQYLLALLHENKLWATMLLSDARTASGEFRKRTATQKYDKFLREWAEEDSKEADDDQFTLIEAQKSLLHLAQAKYQFIMKNIKGSAEACDKARAADSELLPTKYRVAMYYQSALALTENEKTAENRYATIAQQSAGDAEIFMGLLQAYNEAQIYLERATGLAPKLRGPNKALATLYYKQENFLEALKQSDLCLEVVRDDVPVAILKLYILAELIKAPATKIEEKELYQEQFDICLGSLSDKIQDTSFKNDVAYILELLVTMEKPAVMAVDVSDKLQQHVLQVSAELSRFCETSQVSGISGGAPSKLTKLSGALFTSSNTSSSSSSTYYRDDEKKGDLVPVVASPDVLVANLIQLAKDIKENDASYAAYIRHNMIPRDNQPFSSFKLYSDLHKIKLAHAGVAKRDDKHAEVVKACTAIMTFIEKQWQSSVGAKLPHLSLSAAIALIHPRLAQGLPNTDFKPKSSFAKYYQYFVGRSDEPQTEEEWAITPIERDCPAPDNYQGKYGLLLRLKLAHVVRGGFPNSIKTFCKKWDQLDDSIVRDKVERDNLVADITQMFLGNPDFPNAYEFYAALLKMNQGFLSQSRACDSLLKVMEQVQLNLIQTGELSQPCITLLDYATNACSNRGEEWRDSPYAQDGKPYHDDSYGVNRSSFTPGVDSGRGSDSKKSSLGGGC